MKESPSLTPANRKRLRQIYDRIGSPERLLEILDDFYNRMADDVLLGFYFDGKDTHHIATMQSEFLMKAMGAREEYTGKIPARAHDEIAPILQGHFDRRLRILEQTLADHGLSEEDIRTWIAFESAFEPVIVKK